MKSYSFVKLLMKTFAGSAIRRMKSRIITVRATATAYLTVTIRAGEAGIEDYFLEALTVTTLEIADERIIAFPVRKPIFCEIL